MKILIWLLLLPSYVFAQYTEDEVGEFVAGEKSRLWFFDRYQVKMSTDNKCDKGESYTFNKDNTLEHKKCVSGRWVIKKLGWSIEKETDYDWWIKVGDKKYSLVMKDLPQVKEIHLRNLSGSKADPAYDIILKHYIDD